MRIAFFSDIHSNLPAIRTAFERASAMGAEKFFSCGDMIGGGPSPAETIRFLNEKGITAIRGNIERKIAAKAGKATGKKKFPDGKKGNLAWTASRLGQEEMQWLGTLPPDLYFTESGVRIKVTHGSPKSDIDYIYPSITKEALLKKLDLDVPEVLVCGHSHIPFVKSVSGVLVVNCGSVGRPVDGDSSGSFALLDLKAPRPSARIVRFKYPLEELISVIRQAGPPGVLMEEYILGIKVKGA
jgi:putative phosphoesterase